MIPQTKVIVKCVSDLLTCLFIAGYELQTTCLFIRAPLAGKLQETPAVQLSTSGSELAHEAILYYHTRPHRACPSVVLEVKNKEIEDERRKGPHLAT